MPTSESDVRDNEVLAPPFERHDATVIYIGKIKTPWSSVQRPPRMGEQSGPICTIELYEPWDVALMGIEVFDRLEVLYWLDRSRRDLLLQSPTGDGEVHGTFSIRSPPRPNLIATSIVKLEDRDGRLLRVRGLDCFDGTPLVDLKPDRTLFSPLAR